LQKRKLLPEIFEHGQVDAVTFVGNGKGLFFEVAPRKAATKVVSSITIVRFRRLNSTGGEQSIPARLIALMNVEPKWIS